MTMKCIILIAIAIRCQCVLGFYQSSSGGFSVLRDWTREITTAAVAAIDKINENGFIITTLLNPNCVQPPNECPNSNITFWLYTRSHRNTPIKLSPSQIESINLRSKVRTKNPWKVIIHGYTKSKDEIPNIQLRSAYFKKGDYNLISVDYAPLARDKCYYASVKNTPLIANCTVQLIETLVKKGYFKLSHLHVIGFSLGAQIAGQLRDYFSHGKPGRVTGLDPALPFFDGVINREITRESADFVDVIHTNALGRGVLKPKGHIDFYVNGGSIQPGCLQNNNGSFMTCNHNRSPIYFAESINSKKGFWGIPCYSFLKFQSGNCNTHPWHLVIMGDRTPKNKRGIYYLQTNKMEPFALGKVTPVL